MRKVLIIDEVQGTGNILTALRRGKLVGRIVLSLAASANRYHAYPKGRRKLRKDFPNELLAIEFLTGK